MITRPRIALAFGIIGLTCCLALVVVFGIGRAFPGKESFRAPRVSESAVLAFFAAYFVAGVLASCIQKREARMLIAWAAHVAPLIPIPFMESEDIGPSVVCYGAVYLSLARLWFHLLKRDEKKPNQAPEPTALLGRGSS